MAGLNMAVADFDLGYCEAVYTYIINRYKDRFTIDSFSKKEALHNYLSSLDKPLDILLMASDFAIDESLKAKAKVIIILSDSVPSDKNEYEILNKYQNIDDLIKNIINIYTEKCDSKILALNGEKSSKIIAVYSASGGSGKSTIAALMSTISARQGFKTFYLDYQRINSSLAFFNMETDKSFSDILFFLKNKNPNISMKIESVKYTENEFGVDLFAPPECIDEMEEFDGEDMVKLVDELAMCKNYERIFIDLSSGFDYRNRKIMEICHEIVVIAAANEVSVQKTKEFINQLYISKEKAGYDIFEKIIFAANMCTPQSVSKIDNMDLREKQFQIKIPYVPGLIDKRSFSKLITELGNYPEFLKLYEKI